MRNIKNIILTFIAAGMAAITTGCAYDDSELQGRLDGIKDRIEKLKGRIESLNSQLESLSAITSGNVIVDLSRNSDGQWVITYKDSKDGEKTVVIAAYDQMINVPVLGVDLDTELNIYYWTVTVDGQTSFLMKDGAKVPVSGYTPTVSVDGEGYWTVDGVRILDGSGAPVEANDGESCLFKSITTDESGNLVITQGNGEVITLPVQQVLNLTLSSGTDITVMEGVTEMTFTCEATGTNADDAIVAVAEASGVKAVLDRQTGVVTVSIPEGFTSGYVIMVAYDQAEHTVIRPVFYSKAKSSVLEIRTAADLVKFASDVNAQTGVENMKVLLMNDIDMSGITDWVPVGNAVFTGVTSGTEHVSSYTGPAFKGEFDGQGHAIKNFRMAASLEGAGRVYGLFGLIDGATVSNLVMGAESSDNSCFTVSGAGATDAGVIAGVCFGSVIENCTNWIPVDCQGNTVDNVRMTAAGIAGFVYGGTEEGSVSRLSNLVNNASVNVIPGANTKNGAMSVQVAGIAGFSNVAKASTFRNVLSGCTNNGNMTSAVARTSGIIAAMNMHTLASSCVNNGDQTNTCNLSTGARLGNITCIMGPDTELKDCINNGDIVVVSNAATHIGGLVCLVNDNSVTITGGANRGRIIGDIAATSYKGTLVANYSKFAKLDNIIAGGGVGSYNGGDWQMEVITADNYMSYIGKYSTSNASKITNIIFEGESVKVKGISTAADLVAFASAVNSGASTEEWQNEDGGVCLLTDIDMKDVSDWEPIGNGKFLIDNGAITIEGAQFLGKFDGQGHKIKNLSILSKGSEKGNCAGLFGIVGPGAVVQNIIFDATCSLTVTATNYVASGVVAGVVYDGTVRDIRSSAPILFRGNAGSSTFMGTAVVGYTFAEKLGVTLDSIDNFGEITAENLGNNVNGSSSGYHIAGITAFCHAANGAEVDNTVSNCSNYGNITSACGRTAGVVACANRRTLIVNCDNYGNQLNTTPGTDKARLGGITCNIGTASSLSGCTNYGNLISTTSGRCGGITCVANTGTATGCANYGEIITDSENASGVPYRGVFWAYNNGAASWTDCTAAGKVGKYNNGEYIYDVRTEEEKELYLGGQGTNKSVLTNITYLIGTTKPDSGSDADLRILFIGNSFTKDAVEHLPGMLAAAGLNKVQLTHMYYGGRLVPEYYNGWSTSSDYHCYECGPGAVSWTDITGRTIKEVAESGHWDIVTIQEHTGNSAAWVWTDTEKAALQGLIDNIKATQTGTMPKFYYIMSQAYFNMDKIATSQRPTPFTTQEEMFEVIVTQAKKVMAEVSFDDIIATGTVLQNLRTSALDNEMNLTRDGYHMDYGISRYAAACAVFEKLVSPDFGNILMDGNTYRYSNSNTTSGSYSTPVTDENAPVALQAARYALADPYNVTDMAGAGEPQVPDNGIGDIDYNEGNKE